MEQILRYKYAGMAQKVIDALDSEIAKATCGCPEKARLERAVGLVRRFAGYKQNIETMIALVGRYIRYKKCTDKKVSLMIDDAYCAGGALSDLSDDRLRSAWYDLVNGRYESDTELFLPLEEIEDVLTTIVCKLKLK